MHIASFSQSGTKINTTLTSGESEAATDRAWHGRAGRWDRKCPFVVSLTAERRAGQRKRISFRTPITFVKGRGRPRPSLCPPTLNDIHPTIILWLEVEALAIRFPFHFPILLGKEHSDGSIILHKGSKS